MKRIGLTQRVDQARERRDCLDQEWSRLLISLGYWPVPLPNCPDPPAGVSEVVRNLELTGVILTGGNNLATLEEAQDVAPERDRFEGQLIEACSTEDLPVLGVCRGLQRMVVHYGGRLERIADHVARMHALRVNDDCRLPLSARAAVNSFHDYGVREHDLGSPLKAVAYSPDGFVEAVEHERLRQWAIMWHPERDPHDERDAAIIQGLFG